MNETLLTISQRKSCRTFKDIKISNDELNHILQAGLQAPSSMNQQKIIITAITNKNIITKLAKAVAKILQKEDSYSCFYHAPCIVIVSAPRDYRALVKDGSCTLENIFMAATALHIGSCWINQLSGIEDNEEIRAILHTCQIPTDHLVCGTASLGYSDENTSPKEKNPNRIQIID